MSVRRRTRLINLIQSHNQGNVNILCIFYNLFSLLHNPVISSYHKNNDIAEITGSFSHTRECCVAWCVDECDLFRVYGNGEGANVLSYSALGLAIKERSS